jgi:dihydrofolate synthase/folylpolyglutamate synthase
MTVPLRAPSPETERVATTDTLQDILARFDRYHPARIDLTLDRTERLLAALGNPHEALPPVIHVAGTNGKGSTIAFLRAIYEAAGLAVSSYTSPHLVDFTERFVLAGETISNAALCDLLNEVEEINDGQPITEFEIVTAAAFLALSRTPADIVLLETGLGGRYDATNMITAPLATVITPISLDHQAFLGPDIASIAGEKAAIQKAGVPSIIAPQPDEAAAVINRIGRDIGAIPFRAGKDWTTEPFGDGYIFRSKFTTLTLPRPALRGDHQIVNAATAVACVVQCDEFAIKDEERELFGIEEEDIVTGLSQARWPGRLELLPDGPLRQRLPVDWEVWLDAGHIVFGMLDDKDPTALLGPLANLVASVTAVPLAGEPRSQDPRSSAETLVNAGIAADWAPSLDAALESLASTRGGAHILICGSHVIVGAALRGNARPL